MSDYPTITKGLGKLTPSMWDRFMGLLRWYEQSPTTTEIPSNPSGFSRPYLLAKITASAAIGGSNNRYTYTWAEVVLDTDSGFDVRAGGASGTTALNLCEMSNDANNVAPAVDLDGAAYPAGFTMRAIGDCIDSVQLDVGVVIFQVRDTSGVLRQVFALGNSHDGTC